jgi:hypothetical protein
MTSWSKTMKEFLKFPLYFGVKARKKTKTFGEASNLFRILGLSKQFFTHH